MGRVNVKVKASSYSVVHHPLGNMVGVICDDLAPAKSYAIHVSSAIQLAKLSGFSPIATTASTHHTDYLKSLGATHVIDRKA
ncbi:MAG TPA: hypothetical protein VGO47_09170, partial [Chlamydiales bacterium]|nr:hypothetical protein [Chlamydiales bacterium]